MATNYRMRLRNEVASMLKNMYYVFNNETGVSRTNFLTFKLDR
jgi:hypothetical protein